MKEYLAEKLNGIVAKQRAKSEPISEKNWYAKAAEACENVADALLQEKKGVNATLVKGAASKLGAAGASAGVFSIASLLGTASTGTAIGSLSGAAFSSAALAWVGGSVFVGTLVVGALAVAGGLGAAIGAGWVMQKYWVGYKRKASELDDREKKVLEACLSLATAFRQYEKSSQPLNPIASRVLVKEALEPLSGELELIVQLEKQQPIGAKLRLKRSLKELVKVVHWMVMWTEKYPNVSTGVVSSTFLLLLSDGELEFDTNQLLVIDALRRSTTQLHDASIDEISTYLSSKSPDQLLGIQNNVKGIYHELRFAAEENADGDEYVVELFEATNHPGADVIITNLATGEVIEVQLKATNYVSYVQEHNEKYQDIQVFTTSEVAGLEPTYASTGLSNSALKADVADTFTIISESDSCGVELSMAVAATLALARNVNVLLKGKHMSRSEKSNMVQAGAVSAGVAGLISLVVG